MALLSGTRLGPYEIISLLGAGGMGEVYKARDTRLDRIVAIKVSGARFSDRFDREARAVAALNHPHICTLHDIGPDYLVMEYIQGEPVKGPLPIAQVLTLAVQIAGALDAAHRKGIVHRDLKPANILVAKSGVKLLDFGLAKMESPVAPLGAETVSRALTQDGAIVGTLQYMAPEQLQGKETDARSDIFAFGAVLYEMLTGQRAFAGDDPASVIASIIHKDPRPLSELQRTAPPALDRVLRKCLAKDPDRRWQTAADLRDELQWIGEGGGEAPVPAMPARKAPVAWIAAVVALALVALFGWLRPRTTEAPAAANWKFSITPPNGAEFTPAGSSNATPLVSPDGSSVLFSARGQIYLRRMDGLESVPLRGAAGQRAWSPDSKSIAFFSERRLMKMRVPDGAPELIAAAPQYTRSISWSRNGTIVFVMSVPGEGLRPHMVPATGGTPVRLDIPGLKDGDFYYPEFLPNGEDLLFLWSPANADEAGIYLATLRDGKLSRGSVLLRKNETAGRYSPVGGGQLLFVQNDNLYAQKLDTRQGKCEGEPEVVIQGIASEPSEHSSNFSVSLTGVLAWRPGKAALSRITWFDRQGHETATAGPPGAFHAIRLSKDDKRVVAEVLRKGALIVEPNQSGSFSIPGLARPFWSEDASSVIGHPGYGTEPILEHPLSGGGPPRELGRIHGSIHDLTPDRKALLYTSFEDSLYWMLRDGGQPRKMVQTSGNERIYRGAFSPDARWVLYMLVGPNTYEVYAQPFPAGGLRQQIAASRAEYPVWRRDGKEILYLAGLEIRSVDVQEVGNGLRVGAPKTLFAIRRPPNLTAASIPLQVTRDGSHIVFIQPIEQPGTQVINVAAAWDSSVR